MTDKPQVLFGPWVEVSLVKGYGSIAEFPLMQAELSSGKQTEHVQITIFGENTKEDGIMSNQDKERAEFEAWGNTKTPYTFQRSTINDGYEWWNAELLWCGWQASAERYQSRIAEVKARYEAEECVFDDQNLLADHAERYSLSMPDSHAKVVMHELAKSTKDNLSRIAELEAALSNAIASKPKRLFDDPITADNVRKAIASGFSACEASDGIVVFINTGEEPDYSRLNCPACGGSGHVGDAEHYTSHIAELETEVARLKAGRGWQPIETAPKDGTLILVSFGAKGVRAVYWEDDLWCVDDDKHGPYPLRGYSYSTFTAPTHWMPMPEKPSEEVKGGA